MDIWVEDRFRDFFAWQFTERERKLPQAKQFTETIKKEFAHKSERMYFREEQRWLIHKSKFDLFMDIYWNFMHNIIFQQEDMEFDGLGLNGQGY